MILSSQTLYRARFVLPVKAPLIEDGAILAESGLIRAVGRYHDLAQAYPEASLVDFEASVLLPPMANAHAHLELSSFAEWAASVGEAQAPQRFVEWILWLVRVRRSVGVEQLKDSLKAGLRASLLAGTGAIGDILTALNAVDVYLESPLRGKVYAEVLGQDADSVKERLATIKTATKNQPASHLNWGLSPHAPYTLSTSAMDQVFAFARNHTLQCSIHLAESADETDFLRDGNGAIADKLYASAKWDPLASTPPGCSPARSMCRSGRLGQGDMVIHGIQVDEPDVEQLKSVGASVVLCPRSNAALNVGKAPLSAYLEAGIPLALGTDSLASSASLSIWEEMAFAAKWFAGAATPRTWLEIATHGGAQALGVQQTMGRLEQGLDASFQVVTLPEMPSTNNLEEVLCTSGQNVKVTHLYLTGENVLPES